MSETIDATSAINHPSCFRVSHVGVASWSVAALTIAIEIVTKANGSPMICPAEKPPPRR